MGVSAPLPNFGTIMILGKKYMVRKLLGSRERLLSCDMCAIGRDGALDRVPWGFI